MRSGKGSSGGGKGGKSKSKASKEVITTERKLEVQGDHALILRSAIRTEDGSDKDVLEDFQKLAQFTKNGLNIKIEFHAAPLSRSLFQFAYNLSKTNLKKLYDASGYGWANEEKKAELRDASGRFFFFRNMKVDTKTEGEGLSELSLEEKRETGDVVGYAHIRFSLQGEVVDAVEGEPSLFVDEIQLLPAFQRQGIGKYTMTLLELIARKYKMASVTVPLVKGNPTAQNFFLKALRGFSLDPVYGEDDVQMILSKFLMVPTTASTTAPITIPTIVGTSTTTTTTISATITVSVVEDTSAVSKLPPAAAVTTSSTSSVAVEGNTTSAASDSVRSDGTTLNQKDEKATSASAPPTVVSATKSINSSNKSKAKRSNQSNLAHSGS